MKRSLKFILVLICVVLLLAGCAKDVPQAPVEDVPQTPAPQAPAPEEPEEQKPAGFADGKTHIGLYIPVETSYTRLLVETLEALSQDDPEAGWVFEWAGSADPAAVSQLAEMGCAAIVGAVQDPSLAAQALEAAGTVPYFAAVYDILGTSAVSDTAPSGTTCIDYKLAGVYAAYGAMNEGATTPVFITDGSHSADTLVQGYLQAFVDEGLWEEGNTDLISRVYTGECTPQGGKAAYEAALAELGPEGFDALVIVSDTMAEGILPLAEDKYIASVGGQELGQKWLRDKVVDLEVNVSPALEADILYQQVKYCLTGEEYPPYVYTYIIPFVAQELGELYLIPADPDTYMADRSEGAFAYDIFDARFVTNEAYGEEEPLPEEDWTEEDWAEEIPEEE